LFVYLPGIKRVNAAMHLLRESLGCMPRQKTAPSIPLSFFLFGLYGIQDRRLLDDTPPRIRTWSKYTTQRSLRFVSLSACIFLCLTDSELRHNDGLS